MIRALKRLGLLYIGQLFNCPLKLQCFTGRFFTQKIMYTWMIIYTEKFFDMDRQHGTEAIGIYKKFIGRMDKVKEFLRVAEVLCLARSNNDCRCFIHLFLYFHKLYWLWKIA